MSMFDPKADWVWLQTHHDIETSGTLDHCLRELSPFFPDLVQMAQTRHDCLEFGWAIGVGWTISARELHRYAWESVRP
jgi:hypothetical protein